MIFKRRTEEIEKREIEIKKKNNIEQQNDEISAFIIYDA